MSEKRYWDALSRTDPSHTSSFRRPGGFSGTAVKPVYTNLKMTEVFGPCGIGWGTTAPIYQTVECKDGSVLVYCTVGLWYMDGNIRSDLIYGVGGDLAYGKRADDEAFKKAFTDAIGNAMKFLGMSADVHMGQFDDSKYVRELEREFDRKEREPAKAPRKAVEAPSDPQQPQYETYLGEPRSVGKAAIVRGLLYWAESARSTAVLEEVVAQNQVAIDLVRRHDPATAATIAGAFENARNRLMNEG